MESKRSAVLSLGRLSVFLIALVALSGCHKDPNSPLGGTVGGDKDYLTERYQDTAFDILVYSLPDTGLVVQNAERMLLGSMQDNVFGRADYHIYARLVYAGTNAPTDGFLPDDAIDSVVLVLPYSGLYPTQKGVADGRPIRLTVHELAEEIIDGGSVDSLYPVTADIPYGAAFGPAASFTPRPFDSVYDSLSQQSVVPTLRVRLDASLGQRLMTLPQAAYDSSDVFERYFHGLCLRSVPVTAQEESSVVSFAFGTSLDVTGDVMRVIVYHGLVAEDTARYSVFMFGRVRFTKVERDYSTSTDADFKAQMNGDSTAGGQSVYLACSGGAYMACVLPNIREVFAGRQIIVNRAHLVLNAASVSNGSGITLPQVLQIPGSLDDAYSQDGTWDSEDKAYRLVLTRYLQRLLYEQATPEPFYIYPSTVERYGTPCCVKLNGPKAAGSPMKLEMIYTEVKE
ncbi:MAG: DUF4270 domain-containing protein [Bacteroidales bacterium]|nr:DUF4270 domain-containing protein [Bacteroidales bacterium]